MIHKSMIIQRTLVFLILIALLSVGCTIKKIGEEDKNKGGDEYSTWTKSGKAFDPVAYVDSIWDEKLIPVFKEESDDVNMVLQALAEDKETAVEQYGLKHQSGETEPTFKVKGTAKVAEYDDSSRNGLFMLDLPPFDGETDVPMQVGPVIRKTAIRDSVSFISFTDVGNQLQFASLADELNKRMKKEAVEPLDLDTIEGKTIQFYGAVKLEEGQTIDDVVITPVHIEVVDEPAGEED